MSNNRTSSTWWDMPIGTDISGPSNTLLRLSFSCLFVLLLWRTWKFTLFPLLHASEPKEYPTWIPYFGHVAAFFNDSNGLFEKAKKYFNDTKEPFAVTVLGTTFYVVTEPTHSAEVYKAKTLSFDSFTQMLMRTNGGDEHAVNLLYEPLPANKEGFPNPQGESLGSLAQKMHIHQLHPSRNLNLLQDRAATWMNGNLTTMALQSEWPSTKSGDHGAVEVSLYSWCSTVFTRLGQDVYFGPALEQVNHDLPDSFFNFDECIWQMLYRYPGFLSGRMVRGREQIVTSLEAYFSLPPDQRRSEASWLVNAMEDEAKALGITDRNLAVMVFHLYFAIITNTRRTVFWIVTYLLEHPSLLATYREETRPAFRDGSLVDAGHIQDGSKCPGVQAIWLETLRLCSWSASVRLVVQDTVIGGKLLRKGNQVLVPNRLLHFDESTFGKDVDEFHAERWGNDAALTRSGSWRPFGGGKTMCSGRFLARYLVTCFVATMLERFDIEKVDAKLPFPLADVGRPTLGIVSVKEGYDFRVRISPRSTTSS